MPEMKPADALVESVDWSALYNAADKYIYCIGTSNNNVILQEQDDTIDMKSLLDHLSQLLQSALAVFRKLDTTKDYERIQTLQQIAVDQHSIHTQLLLIVSLSSDQDISGFEKKCRRRSAQLLCNLGTKNPSTAHIILTSLPWSDEYLKPSWMQVILSCSRIDIQNGRPVLVGIIATIYNCITSLQVEHLQNRNAPNWNLYPSIANDIFFVSTCIRQLFPVTALVSFASNSRLEKIQKSQSQEHIGESDCHLEDVSDEATIWFTYMLMKLSSMGLLENLFQSATGCKRQYPLSTQVTPEQILLLHCLAQAVDEYSFEQMDQEAETLVKTWSPVGNCWLGTSRDVTTHVFLAQLWCSYQKNLDEFASTSMINFEAVSKLSLPPIRLSNSSLVDGDEWESYTGGKESLENASKLIIEILANSLSSYEEHEFQGEGIRTKLGKNTSMVSYMVKNMEQSIRRLNVDNQNMTESSILIDHVRLLGNLCYRCKHNQDLLRITFVPSKGDEAKAVVSDNKDDLYTLQNGLHLLLSCTSVALHCFPLREWTIVAIRNALEDNEENQKIVHDLQAQYVVNTPELQSMGVGLKMDAQGKVVVEPK